MTEFVVATGDVLVHIQPQPDAWRAAKLTSGRGMQCLAADPSQPDVLFAGSRGEGVWRSTNRGRNWTRLQFAERDVFALAVSPVDGAVYVGTEPSKLFVSRDDGLTWRELKALQEIPSRSSWSFPPRPWTSHIRCIAPSPHDAELLLVGIELGGVMRSDNGGRTWRDHPAGAQEDVHTLCWHPTSAGRAYEAGGGGAAWSRDGGINWQPADVGRDRHFTWGLAVDPNDPDCWYVSANPSARLAHDGAGGAAAFVYRWSGAGPWQPLGGELPQPFDSFPYALALDSDSVFAGLGDGRIYRSDHRGDEWTLLDIQGEPPECVLAWITIP